MNIENMSDSDIRSMEAQIKAKNSEIRPTFQHYGSVENMSDSDIRRREAEIKSRSSEVKPTYQHYGSVENMSDNDIRSMEAQIKTKNSEIRPTFQHYGSVENMSDNDIKIIEAQVAERRTQDVPYKEYFNNLIVNANILDTQQFEEAVIRSMQSNGLMKDFTFGLVNEISKNIYVFKHIDKTDTVNIQNQKQKIENLINVYVRYLYSLKSHGWTFYGPGNDIGLEMISSDMLDNLWQLQKQFGLNFDMPIPKNLGEYYGQAFERKGKMVPGLTLMYDELKNKEVNWHQVLIYKENELTPRQRYMQRKEAALKQFEATRQEEIKNTLVQSHAQAQQNNNVVSNIGNLEQVNSASARR